MNNTLSKALNSTVKHSCFVGLFLLLQNLLHYLKCKFHIKFTKKYSGIGSIEMILILLVLVSIIVIFRSQITNIVNSVFEKIREQINDF